MKTFIIALLLVLVACNHSPSKTDITCQSGHGTCYVVHCEGRETQDCQSYFKNFCPKGFEDKAYGIVTPGNQDRLVECK